MNYSQVEMGQKGWKRKNMKANGKKRNNPVHFGLIPLWAKGGLEEYGKKCKHFGKWKLHTFGRKKPSINWRVLKYLELHKH